MSVRLVGPACLRAVLAPVLVLALFASLMTALPTAAGATHRTRHRTVHRCTGFHNAIRHDAVWTDYASEASPLTRNMDKLICSAADNSTIDLKSWFLVINDSYLLGMVSRLRLMHRYHHVRVNVFVGRNAHRKTWRSLRKTFSFAHMGWCARACKAPDPDGVSHSKWITVSKLRNGKPAVLSTSANWSHEQLGLTEESGIFVSGNSALYRDFVDRWNIYQHCFQHRCSTVVGRSGWRRAGYFAVHFAPSSNDAIADELSTVQCGAEGHVDVMSLAFHRPAVLEQLLRLIGTGCHVRMLLERTFTPYTGRTFNPQHVREHDKCIVVWTGHRREVLAGSEDIGTREMSHYDNQMLRVRVPSMVRTYNRIFDHQWHISRVVPPTPRLAGVPHLAVRAVSTAGSGG